MDDTDAKESHVHLEEHFLIFFTSRGLDLFGELDYGLEMGIMLLILHIEPLLEPESYKCLEWRNLLQAIDWPACA